jgi:hypothetical protein
MPLMTGDACRVCDDDSVEDESGVCCECELQKIRRAVQQGAELGVIKKEKTV